MFDFEDDMKATFLEEAQSLIDDSEAAFMAVDAGDRSPELIDKIFRLAHNFKSSAKTVGLQHLSDFAHIFEDVLTKIKSGQLVPDKAVCTVLLKTLDCFREYVAKLKADLTYQHDVSEITLALQALGGGVAAESAAALEAALGAEIDASPAAESVAQATAPSGAVEAGGDQVTAAPPAASPSRLPPAASAPPAAGQGAKPPTEDENIKVNRQRLDTLLNLIGELVVSQSMVTSHKNLGTLESAASAQTLKAMEKTIHEIQNLSLSLRMTPIAPLLQKLKRIARDASGALGKTISFVTEGEHVELDKIVIDRISDPLTHLIRNGVDHGIESDEERGRIGKSGASTIVLRAQQQEDRVLITLSDNGRGMDPKKLIAKAQEKGLIDKTAVLSDQEAYGLIFKPGFSTKEQVTDMSGRGVGMDVVQRSVTDLKGTIEIDTKLGEGTQFTISLPLSMSILTGMVVNIAKQKYVIPISQLVETVDLGKFALETSTGRGTMFSLRGEVIPVYSLAELLMPSNRPAGPAPLKPAALPKGTGVITSYNGRKFSFAIDQICGQQEIVLKKLGHEMRGLPGVVAGAILSTGEPGFVLNLSEFIEKGVDHAA